MSINRKCPKCGSDKVQLSSERSKHGCLFLILFGVYYLCWLILRWCIGLTILCLYDWWMSILQKNKGQGYVWQSLKWFSNTKKIYYCHNCGNNFRA